MLAVAGGWWLARDDDPAAATVPRVLRLAERDAVERLGRDGFTVVVERRRSDGAPRGFVLEQQPRSGLALGSGSIVTLIVSSGAATAVVPDVTGLAVGRAEVVLRRARLPASRVDVLSDEPRGIVVGQYPPANGRIGLGQAVRLNVSRGTIRRVTVPNVVGRALAEARALLRRSGLGPPVVSRVPSNATTGDVVSQTPVDGSQLVGGHRVRIAVSDGPAPTGAPEPENPHTPIVVGFGEEEAVQTLEDLGYRVRVRTRHTDSPAEDGTVVEQDPPDSAPRGRVITLVVGTTV